MMIIEKKYKVSIQGSIFTLTDSDLLGIYNAAKEALGIVDSSSVSAETNSQSSQPVAEQPVAEQPVADQ